jgi:hypothetical protein
VFLGAPLPGPGQVLWTDEDQAWALALLQVEAETCRGCGQPLGESTDADLEELWQAEVIKCHACVTAGHRAESWQKSGGSQHGANIHVTRREALPWQTASSTSG